MLKLPQGYIRIYKGLVKEFDFIENDIGLHGPIYKNVVAFNADITKFRHCWKVYRHINRMDEWQFNKIIIK